MDLDGRSELPCHPLIGREAKSAEHAQRTLIYVTWIIILFSDVHELRHIHMIAAGEPPAEHSVAECSLQPAVGL